MHAALLLLLPAVAAGFALPGGGPRLARRSGRVAVAMPAAKQSFDSFEGMLTSFDVPVLVDFYAVWCGPCQMMSPLLEQLGAANKDRVRVAKVDTDAYPDIGSRYKVEGLPTLVLFKEGKEVWRAMGVLNPMQIMTEIGPFLPPKKAADAPAPAPAAEDAASAKGSDCDCCP